jgi:dihydroorotate dehydrogenase electron transfer subunit/dihydroorotate dehydrogenase (NAD+) catalytic subunit
MNSFVKSIVKDLSQTGLAGLGIKSPFTIPSGIVTTVPSVIARIALDVPAIGFLTTKTVSVEPRAGYREPVVHEYYPGCFVNAVGLANPGARKFLQTMQPLLPLHDNKPLIVSIMGKDAEEFLECALILDPIADAFELNLSCPHVKGAGQNIGSDPDTVRTIINLLKQRVKKPIIPKLSPNLGDIPGMARLCEEEGADALCLINTVGPGVATDTEGHPVLTNVAGGVSGSGILPIGLKAVREAALTVRLPIIAAGGMASPEDVRAYREVGASLFSTGSALAGMDTSHIADFFRDLVDSLEDWSAPASAARCVAASTRTDYFKTRVTENVSFGSGLFKLRFEEGPECPPGCFFFLRLPGIGEKPFSPARDVKPVYLVRTVGPFTNALAQLKPGDPIYMRGPYGKGFPEPQPGSPLVLVAGGTGTAPIMLAAARWPAAVSRAFFGFSENISESFQEEMMAEVPSACIAIDQPGQIGQVVRALANDIAEQPDFYKECQAFICGPDPMMNSVAALMGERTSKERLFIAREDIMRCGIGLCGSCGTKSGLRSCVDGPVLHPE